MPCYFPVGMEVRTSHLIATETTWASLLTGGSKILESLLALLQYHPRGSWALHYSLLEVNIEVLQLELYCEWGWGHSFFLGYWARVQSLLSKNFVLLLVPYPVFVFGK